MMTFDAAIARVMEIHARKGKDYGTDEDDRANLRASEAFGIPAWVGTLIRADDKIRRLQAFAQRGRLENESVEDSLLDLATYAVLALSLYPQTPVAEQVNPGDNSGTAGGGHYEYNWRRPGDYYKKLGGAVWEQVTLVDGEWVLTGEVIPGTVQQQLPPSSLAVDDSASGRDTPVEVRTA